MSANQVFADSHLLVDQGMTSDPSEFFFIQISDAHVYDRQSDYADFSSPDVPWYIPQIVVEYMTVSLLKGTYGDDAINGLRDALLSKYMEEELKDMWDISVYRAYSKEMEKTPNLLGSLDENIRDALTEVVSLDPVFVINTGDLVLESNKGSAEAIDRWFKYYISITGTLQTRFFNTIGNNEIAGTQREDFTSDHPQFGKYFFKKYFGPTHYSFDYGSFHFVALDTHSPAPEKNKPDWWSFTKMEPEVLAWADADMKANQDKTLVVLNHEPFHFDPEWPFETDGTTADDEGLFDKYGVDYVLSGHTHFKSFMMINEIPHLTTGALSGLRWILPSSIHPRGYRLFYAKDRSLYSAWKLSGEEVIAFSEPQPAETQTRVIALSDKARPFNHVEITLDGTPINFERWGEYFLKLNLPDTQSKILKVQAFREDGTELTKELVLY